jgi:Cytidylate kinase-like family
MIVSVQQTTYVPGSYARKRPGAAQTAQQYIRESDKEQQEFFKKAFGRKEATPYEFDLVINFDHLKRPASAAAVVAAAFREKFKNRSAG